MSESKIGGLGLHRGEEKRKAIEEELEIETDKNNNMEYITSELKNYEKEHGTDTNKKVISQIKDRLQAEFGSIDEHLLYFLRNDLIHNQMEKEIEEITDENERREQEEVLYQSSGVTGRYLSEWLSATDYYVSPSTNKADTDRKNEIKKTRSEMLLKARELCSDLINVV